MNNLVIEMFKINLTTIFVYGVNWKMNFHLIWFFFVLASGISYGCGGFKIVSLVLGDTHHIDSLNSRNIYGYNCLILIEIIRIFG